MNHVRAYQEADGSVQPGGHVADWTFATKRIVAGRLLDVVLLVGPEYHPRWQEIRDAWEATDAWERARSNPDRPGHLTPETHR
ncbi:hypothetical protein GCM10010156_48600 [Planobispora rosea]|uniref:Uncharacterized protein n=1 Tax=Planobispora rosea TaxID=35762 RepID=A0A8J3WFZ4_PLARO|nr:hypothetical protein [Planobispora rosea]GGS84279.1 hypothetical protein GCM10010156_48600 [Planobispora rosea]GIH86371.1 hypothetical protein Pro02_47790 [Planobispora rosea]